MTEQEAKGFIQGKLDCMDRCDVFDCKGTDECDNCVYCYSQGNFGEQKKAFAMAIKSMEKQIPKKVVNVDDFSDYAECPSCGAIATDHLGCLYGWCRKCGQKLDWSEEE